METRANANGSRTRTESAPSDAPHELGGTQKAEAGDSWVIEQIQESFDNRDP